VWRKPAPSTPVCGQDERPELRLLPFELDGATLLRTPTEDDIICGIWAGTHHRAPHPPVRRSLTAPATLTPVRAKHRRQYRDPRVRSNLRSRRRRSSFCQPGYRPRNRQNQRHVPMDSGLPSASSSHSRLALSNSDTR
jgi:hypothetical protein